MSQRNEHPSYDTPPAGSIRFNTDSNKMEIYNGEQWWNIDSTSPEEETGGTRGILYAGATSGGRDNVIQFINVSTPGDAVDLVMQQMVYSLRVVVHQELVVSFIKVKMYIPN